MESNERAFSMMRNAFETAQEKRPDLVRLHACTFAGLPGMISVVGTELARLLLPPIRHLLDNGVAATEPELIIELWDAGETGVPYPGLPPDDHLASSEFGQILRTDEDRFLGCLRPNLFAWMDRSSSRIVACTPDGSSLGLYERAKPLLFPLLLWHCDRDVVVVHAALVERAGKGVLFAGAAGAGKSTAALTCVAAGFNYLGDDYIGLRPAGDGQFVGHSLFNSAWLDPNHPSSFPDLAPQMMPGGLPKLPIILSDVYPEQLSRAAPVRVLVLPRVVRAARRRLRPATKKEALFALAPSSLLKRPCSGQTALEWIAGLVECTPAYVLESDADLTEIPACVEELLDLESAT